MKTKDAEKLADFIDEYREYIYNNQLFYIYSKKQFAVMNATLDYILGESCVSQFHDALDFLNHIYEIFSSLIKYEDDMFDIGQNVISDLIYSLVEDNDAYNGRMIYG